MTDLELVDDLRRTFDRAAAGVDVGAPPFASLGVRAVPSTGVRRHRWLWPLAAAAAVAGLALAFPLSNAPDQASDAAAKAADAAVRAAGAAVLTVTGDVADVGGVRFPVPAGWRPGVTAADEESVTVCVAVAPAASCDGVQLLIAVPAADGTAAPLRSDFVDGITCGPLPTYIRLDEAAPTLGGRPANHYWKSCGENGSQSHQWQLDDLRWRSPRPTAAGQTRVR